MLPYFPFQHKSYQMTMGVQALDPRLLIEIDEEQYQSELALKNLLLTEEPAHYFYEQPEMEESQWEVVEILLPILAERYPQHFQLERAGTDWHWRNHLQQQEWSFCLGAGRDLELAPLDWLGRQVQEDLLLVSGIVENGLPLLGGQLCFPNGWSLAEKVGQPFLTIHETVPLFAEKLGRSSQLLLERLKPERPVWRLNWALKSLPRLNLLPQFYYELPASYEGLTSENAGERIFFRVERQVLVRLPRTGQILFLIHTYQTKVQELIANPERMHLLRGVLQTLPAEVITYKGIDPFYDQILKYLDMQ
ncbi:heme-dependent oxidative N-demethylase family protein [Tengunoibacter tsumagoiensis]|uniref:DUF3445 domain-containing protein n=1 Tax=Tengunoibacter tsumagoiensis TaxID=2014871 RepID=A0A401ZWD2_9CHLR|nr:DUF3445 domain-containing protein [Tengunoibacter tsumagoiensis]GCE11116.1 hypothetical protein KTT_09750 [Tengunoibacter tsumagoiensis]